MVEECGVQCQLHQAFSLLLSALHQWRAQHLISARIFSRLLVSRSVSREREAKCSSWLLATSPLNPAIRDSCSRMACTRHPICGSDGHAAHLSRMLHPLYALHALHPPGETKAQLAVASLLLPAPHLFKGWFGDKLLYNLLLVQAHDLSEHLRHLL